MQNFIKKGMRKLGNYATFGYCCANRATDKDSGVISPAHDQNACWMNSTISGLSHLLNLGAPGNFFKNLVLSVKDSKFKRLLTDMEKIKEGKEQKLSKESMDYAGYVGKQGAWTDFVKSTINPTLETVGLKLKVVPDRYDAGWEWFEKNANGQKITFFLGHHADLLGLPLPALDHVTVIHALPPTSSTAVKKKTYDTYQFMFADDKGTGLSYTPRVEKITKEKAEDWINKECCGLMYLEEGEEGLYQALTKQKIETTTDETNEEWVNVDFKERKDLEKIITKAKGKLEAERVTENSKSEKSAAPNIVEKEEDNGWVIQEEKK